MLQTLSADYCFFFYFSSICEDFSEPNVILLCSTKMSIKLVIGMMHTAYDSWKPKQTFFRFSNLFRMSS